MTFQVSDYTFPEKPVSTRMAQVVAEVCRDKSVWDLGCGSGIIGISAVNAGAAHVMFTDINEYAINDTERNLESKASSSSVKDVVTLLRADMFSFNVPRKFDVIASNPPCMSMPEQYFWHNKYRTLAINGGPTGCDLVKQVVQQARSHLTEFGMLVIPVARWSDFKAVENELKVAYRSLKTVDSFEVPYYLINDTMTRFGSPEESKANSELMKQHIERLLGEGIIEVHELTSDGIPSFKVDIICASQPR